MATLTLDGNNLPDPQVYTQVRLYRGKAVRMADGTVRRDLLTSVAKHKFYMEWVALTDAEKTTITTAFADIDDAQVTFTDHGSTSYTVVRGEEMTELEFNAVPAASGYLWATNAMILEEI